MGGVVVLRVVGVVMRVVGIVVRVMNLNIFSLSISTAISSV